MKITAFVRQHPAASYFGLVLVWSYLYWQALFTLLPVNPQVGPTPLHVGLAALGASPSWIGLLLIWFNQGQAGFRELLARLGRRQVGWGWYAAALLLLPGINAASALLYQQLTGNVYPITAAAVGMGLIIGIMSSLLEEFGWRGFALPVLQKRYSTLVASLIVGIGWGVWHLRLNSTMLAPDESLVLPLLLLSAWGPLGLTAATVLMTWVYNNTQGSLLHMLLMHFSLTSSFFVFGPPPSTHGAELLVFHLVTLGLQWSAAALVIALGGVRLQARHPQEMGAAG